MVMSGVCCEQGCTARMAWGALCSPSRPRPVCAGRRGQRPTQTTRMQLGKAKVRADVHRPGVKYKVAEWGKLKINPKDLCRKTPSKHGEARGEEQQKNSPLPLPEPGAPRALRPV